MASLPDIFLDFPPARERREFGTWNLGEWMEKKPIGGQDNGVGSHRRQQQDEPTGMQPCMRQSISHESYGAHGRHRVQSKCQRLARVETKVDSGEGMASGSEENKEKRKCPSI